MLAKEQRLRHDKDIKALFAKGKSVFGMQIGIKFKKNQLPTSRFTVVVGTKVSKRAVERNRLKRRLRAIVQKHFETIAPGYDVMILTKKEALTKTFAELETQACSLFKKIPPFLK